MWARHAQKFRIESKVALCGKRIGKLMERFGAGTEGEVVVAGVVGEEPSHAVGKFIGVEGGGEIAVGLVFDHVGEATDVESDGGRATGESFHDGVGEVVLGGRGDKEVSSSIEGGELSFIVDKAHGMGGDGGESSLVKVARADDDEMEIGDGGVVDEAMKGREEEVIAFALVIGVDGSEEDELGVEGQAELGACLVLGQGAIEVGVDAIGDEFDAFVSEERAMAGTLGEPTAGCDNGEG
jgi:hypothetical protein